jgi:tetratricopeptide (TPR) repeat protein
MAAPKPDESTLFNAARRIEDPAARRLYVREACGDDGDLADRVEALLRMHDEDPTFLASPPQKCRAHPGALGGSPTMAAAPAPDGEGAPLSRFAPAGYEILGELGRGGMGVVYKARQAGLNRLVALKMILAGSHAGPDELARFRTEAEAVAALQHPNIVQIYEVGERDSLPYFSLELVEGGSLADRLDGTPWPPRAAAALVAALARATHYAHSRGVVHRDLKPGNVLLTKDGTPKITDFGLAKQLDSAGRTRTGAVMGTPSYMAPEQAGGKSKEIGPACDTYALGAILYELLTGRPPFRAETPLDTILQVIDTEPLPPSRLQPKLPRDLETICLKCLEKVPAGRYASAGALADDVQRFLDSKPIQARPTPAWERLAKWARRNPTLTAVSGCALVALAAAALLAYRGHLTEQQRHAEKKAHEDQYLAEVLDRALAAAMSGDLDGADKAIGEAESLGASPGQVHMLRGQVAFHRGDVAAATDELEHAVRLLPESVAARAMLTLAYYNGGQTALMEQAWQHLGPMTPSTPEDFLFQGQIEAILRPERSLQTLDEAVRRRNSAIAHAVRADARANRALFTGAVSDAESALDDALAARVLLPDNPFVLGRSLLAGLVAAGIYEDKGQAQDRERALEQAGRDARELKRFTSSPVALKACFWYFSYVGDEDTAFETSRHGPEFRHAWMLYRRKEYPQALQAVDRAVAQGVGWSHVERAFILAELPDGPARAGEQFQDAQAKESRFGRVTAPMILLLLGQGPEAIRASQAIRGEPAALPPWDPDWYRRYLDYFCGALTGEELLQAAGPCRPKRCEAHFAIGLHRLAEGDREGAKEHFRKCAATRIFIYWDYMWARAFLERLENEPGWPPWIGPRR